MQKSKQKQKPESSIEAMLFYFTEGMAACWHQNQIKSEW